MRVCQAWLEKSLKGRYVAGPWYVQVLSTGPLLHLHKTVHELPRTPHNRWENAKKPPENGSRGAELVSELDISDSECAQKENPPDAGSGGCEKGEKGSG